MSVDGIAEYVSALKASPLMGHLITCHMVMEEEEAHYASVTRPWPRAMTELLANSGISSLYAHQTEAIDAIRQGKSVVVSTPTASGKSLIYNLPVIERHLHDPEARSLYLFPLKALAQDQLAGFEALTEYWPQEARPKAGIYDGDTSAHFRKKIRENLPTALFTNPEMLHLALLPFHHLWATLFAGLSYVIVDEVHTYRGLLGSHMAQVFRRLLRIASLYGASPVFIFCSATVGNPEQLATGLTGITPVPVLKSTAPKGKRHYLFINPEESPATTAIKLLKSALARGLRTIVYCQSRRMTELISLWASQHAGDHAAKISAYRAGYLPEERRAIEAKMSSGELLAVISTSALELGIDIGSLDLCILVGYPGTVMATLQRGGRVGRLQQESAVILVAQEDALDQYIVRHPDDFFSRPAETAVINPENPVIVARHLECAAAELPLKMTRSQDAAWLQGEVATVAQSLEKSGVLLRTADGKELMASRKRPQRHVALRGSGMNINIVNEKKELIGSVDGIRAQREAHPGALYLHHGEYYEISRLDLHSGIAYARRFKAPWYTKARSTKDTSILSVEAGRVVGGMALQFGRLRVTDLVTGYEKRAHSGGQLLGVVPLDFEPQVFETEGFWFMVPHEAQQLIEDAKMHFMGSIHALEHAVIGLLPLMVMTDRNDLGGISKPMHLQTGKPTVFVYDGMPGGAGLSRDAFAKAEELFHRVEQLIADCPCELGCPSCVHSPKCGSGNRPIDKEGALALVKNMLRPSPASVAEAHAALEITIEPEDPPAIYTDSSFTGTNRIDTRIMGAVPMEFTPDTASWAEEQEQFTDEMAEEFSLPPFAAQGGQHDGNRDERPGRHEPAPHRQQPAQAFVGTHPSTTNMDRPVSAFPNTKQQKTGQSMSQTLYTPGMPLPENYAVLDVETRYSAAEVGGWNRADRMGVSIAVLYDSRTNDYTPFTQEDIPEMAQRLSELQLVIGFNIAKFDYAVLAPHAPGFSFKKLPTLDLLNCVHSQLSYRVSLDNIATATLGAAKSASGLLALEWWKQQKLDLIEEYCQKDVELTRDIFLFGKENGYVLFSNKAGQQVRVRATWAP